MDEAQGIGGLYCLLAQYMTEVIRLVPTGSKLRLAFNPFLGNYANYYFYGNYLLVQDYQQADYLVIFLSGQKFSLSPAGDLSLESDGQRLSIGHWQSIAIYNPEIMILKRL